jgi:hypothetical protein
VECCIVENTLIVGGCDNVIEVDGSSSELAVTPRDPKPTNKIPISPTYLHCNPNVTWYHSAGHGACHLLGPTFL